MPERDRERRVEAPARRAPVRCGGPLAASVLAVTALLPAPRPASSQPATVEGMVYDSTLATGLAGARVAILTTALVSQTDSAGRFRIDDVPPGSYRVSFFHPRLQHLGVSAGGADLVVESGRAEEVLLTTPSMRTILAAHCATEDPGRHEGRLVGRVLDGTSGVGLPGARVWLSWTEEGRTRTDSAFADREGWYRACAVPEGVPVSAAASFVGEGAARRDFNLEEGTPLRLDLPVGGADPVHVSGVLLDAVTGQPVAGAELRLGDGGVSAVTDDRGRFAFEAVHPGEYRLAVDHLGYGERTAPVAVGGSLDLSLDVRVEPRPVEVEGLTVTVRSEVEERAVSMGGRLIGPEAVEAVRHRSRDLIDVLRQQNVPGLILRRDGSQLCVGFTAGQVKMFRRGGCDPAEIYVDGVHVTDPLVAANMSAEAIDRIVLFRPVEAGNLFKLGSADGVVLVFTRSGRR